MVWGAAKRIKPVTGEEVRRGGEKEELVAGWEVLEYQRERVGRERNRERGEERGEREILSLPQENDTLGFPGGPVVKIACFHCRGHGFHPWSRNSPHASRCAPPKKKKERKKITPYATDKPLGEFLCLQNSTAIESRCSAFCHTRPARALNRTLKRPSLWLA